MHTSPLTLSLLILALLSQTSASADTASQCASKSPARLISFNPSTLLDSTGLGYSQITVDTRTHTAHIAGQIAFDVSGKIVGATLREQLGVAERNVRLALEAVGATVDDILRLNIYIVDRAWDAAAMQYTETGVSLRRPPSTLVTVPRLALDDALVELEATAAVSEEAVQRLACREE